MLDTIKSLLNRIIESVFGHPIVVLIIVFYVLNWHTTSINQNKLENVIYNANYLSSEQKDRLHDDIGYKLKIWGYEPDIEY